MKKHSRHVCIVGGGITGYAFAYYLAKRKPDYSITIVEKEKTPGGLAKAVTLDEKINVDKFYHFLYSNDSKNTLDFFNELGLTPRVVWKTVKSSVFIKDQLFSIDDMPSLFKVKLLTLFDKVRFVFAMVRILFTNTRVLDGIQNKKYLVRLFGTRTYRLIWKPLLDSKFSGYSNQVPASWIARRIKVTFLSRSLSGKTKYGYITGTYKPLFKKLKEVLRKHGVNYINSSVTGIKQIKGSVRVEMMGKKTQHYDDVVLATPIGISRKLIQHAEVKKQYSKYKELDVYVSLLLLKKRYSPYFWINVNDSSIPFTGIIELTNIADTSLFNGYHVLYLSEYLSDKRSLDTQDWDKSMIRYLKKVNPNFKSASIASKSNFFASGVAPVPFINFLKHMPPFQSLKTHIFLLNSSMIYPEDRGVGNSIALAKKHIDMYLQENE